MKGAKESSYNSIKEGVMSILQFKNRNLSICVFASINILFALTTFTRLSFIFLISVIMMTIAMGALFYGFISMTFSPADANTTPYTPS